MFKSYSKKMDVFGLERAECCIKVAVIVTSLYHVIHNYVVLGTNRNFKLIYEVRNRGYVRLSLRLWTFTSQ
jgi:hypothetical protein